MKSNDNYRDLQLEALQQMMRNNGVVQLLVKELAPNDNSKNQPYVARGNLDAINILPIGEFRLEETDKGNKTLKAPLDFYWLQPDGRATLAPGAQVILYPQYPEIRLSGFLKGTKSAPNDVMNTRQEGRLLLLGVTDDRRIIAWASPSNSDLARSYSSLKGLEKLGIFYVLPLTKHEFGISTRSILISELRRIHELDWIDSKALNTDGSISPCNSTHCVGYTLEAEFGIARNGRAEPDFKGWEIKASKVAALTHSLQSKPITLMTPEPTGGLYRTNGLQAFIRKFGYIDKLGREDRLNFGGIFRVNERHETTRLTLKLDGFDLKKDIITNSAGSLALVSDSGVIAAEWSFAALMTLWNRKHAQAVYVPAEEHKTPVKKYRYGSDVRFGEGTDFTKLLRAISLGHVYYDPGIKMEKASSSKPVTKRRSQFRVKSKDLAALYSSMQQVSVL